MKTCSCIILSRWSLLTSLVLTFHGILFFQNIYRYIAWNIHEPRPGQHNFNNDSDIESFIKLVNSLELLLIVRPGKYQQYVVESATRSAACNENVKFHF